MFTGILFVAIVFSTTCLTITEPVDGSTCTGDWLTIQAIVENENELPDSVNYTLNDEPVIQVPRLNTDWYTYMQNNLHHGYSDSPAPADNTILWTAPVTGDTHEFCGPVVVNGRVYFVSDEQSTAYALDAATGDVLWQYDVVNHVDDAVTWYEGKVYIAADSAWCLDAVTGDRIWSYKESYGIKMNGTPAVADGIAYFTFVPDYNSRKVCAVDAETGEEIWVTEIPYYTTGCVTLYEEMLFVPTFQGKLYALDISTGLIIWENSDSEQGYWDSSPVVVDDVIYISGFDGKIRGIDAVTGNTLWESEISVGTRYIAATPAYCDERLYFADQVDSFHCLDALTGNSIWTAPGVQHGSSGIAEGTVFYGEGADRNYGRVVALSRDSGEEIWSYQTGGGQLYSSPAITDGVLYIAGMDWNLYAFGTGLKYTYTDDLYAQVGENELIVTSFDGGAAVAADTISFTVSETGINFQPSNQLCLAASPNPFISTASISFELSEQGLTLIEVFDLAGRLVSTLENSELSSGQHSYVWNGRKANGERVSAGLYFCRIQSGEISETTGLCLLR